MPLIERKCVDYIDIVEFYRNGKKNIVTYWRVHWFFRSKLLLSYTVAGFGWKTAGGFYDNAYDASAWTGM